jgi:hypothetical protein
MTSFSCRVLKPHISFHDESTMTFDAVVATAFVHDDFSMML